MISLIAMDMDGTLLGPKCDAIPEENVAALKAAAKAGIHLALCTGRSPDDASLFAKHADLPMHILATNGTCCLSEPLGTVTESHFLPEETVHAVYAAIEGLPVESCLFTENTLIYNTDREHTRDFAPLWAEWLQTPEARGGVQYSNNGIKENAARANKIYLSDYEGHIDIPALRQHLREIIPGADISASSPNNVEICPIGINKGTALEALAKRLNIPMSQVMAIGDEANDLSMLKVAGVPVVMGNGAPEPMEIAAYVTLCNSRNGVAAAVRKIALSENVPGVRKLD